MALRLRASRTLTFTASRGRAVQLGPGFRALWCKKSAYNGIPERLAQGFRMYGLRYRLLELQYQLGLTATSPLFGDPGGLKPRLQTSMP